MKDENERAEGGFDTCRVTVVALFNGGEGTGACGVVVASSDGGEGLTGMSVSFLYSAEQLRGSLAIVASIISMAIALTELSDCVASRLRGSVARVRSITYVILLVVREMDCLPTLVDTSLMFSVCLTAALDPCSAVGVRDGIGQRALVHLMRCTDDVPRLFVLLAWH